jgi:hypothetical protein
LLISHPANGLLIMILPFTGTGTDDTGTDDTGTGTDDTSNRKQDRRTGANTHSPWRGDIAMGNSVGVLVSRVWDFVSATEGDYPLEDEAKPGSRSCVTILRAVNHVNHGQGDGGRMPFSEYTTILRLSDSDPQHFSLSFSCYEDLDLGDTSMAFTEKQYLGIVKPVGALWILATTHEMTSDSGCLNDSFEKRVISSCRTFRLHHIENAQIPTVEIMEEGPDNAQILHSNLYPRTLFHTFIAED